MKGMIWVLSLAIVLTAIPMQTQAAGQGVEVGGIHILKTDMTGKSLEGAVFEVVQEVDPMESGDRALEKKLMKIGEKNQLVAVISFWPNREMSGSRQKEVRTDQSGRAAIYGLPFGTYYLVEREAPEGYNRITSPIRLSIHRYSHLTDRDGVLDDEGKTIDNTMHIVNVRYTLPDTGHWGRVQLAAGAVGILFSSFALILMRKRKRGQ